MDLDVKITHGHITGQRPGMVLMKPRDQRCFRSTNLRLFHSRRHVLDAPLSNKVTNDRFMLACLPARHNWPPPLPLTLIVRLSTNRFTRSFQLSFPSNRQSQCQILIIRPKWKQLNAGKSVRSQRTWHTACVHRWHYIVFRKLEHIFLQNQSF